uniref:Uncharacterized LOC100180654 n=1 Tax=Ciona intestinalis TaxID=7719 RepID=F6RIC2_CIOIN|nr:uncharacterized protein LOC100180654 [Ciona intestinalis]|eukprot:XP_002125571.1 uncharacterized protein LOC100180654 [Ciona intestinalis]
MEVTPDSWSATFGESKLENRVVSHHVVDWSDCYTVAVATGRSVVIYSMGLYSESQKLETSFSVENIPRKANVVKHDVGIESYLSEFESLCNQSSNVAAYPDYSIYKIQLDPLLSQATDSTYNEYDMVRFSPRMSTKFTNHCFLATLTLDNRCAILYKVSTGAETEWKEIICPSEQLHAYLNENKRYFPGFKMDSTLTKLEKLIEQKYAASIACMDWSDVYTRFDANDETKEVYFATSTRAGFVVIWRCVVPDFEKPNLNIVYVFQCSYRDIAEIKWCRYAERNRTKTSDNCSLCISSLQGQISVCRFKIKDDSITLKLEREIWGEKDNLIARHFQFIDIEVGCSMLLAAKSQILIAMKLNANLEVCAQVTNLDAHIMPITGMSVVKHGTTHGWYTCSGDGTMVKLDVVLDDENIKLNKEILGTSSDIGAYKSISPSMMHGIAVSPNAAFIAVVTSKPIIISSIQVNNVAFLSFKRNSTPYNAAVTLQSAAFEQNSLNVCYHFLDVIEIIRQHYFVNQNLETVLEEFLTIAPNNYQDETVKLQLRWHLLQIKYSYINSCQTPSPYRQNENTDPNTKLLEEKIKEVELLLIVSQMLKVIKLWCENGVPLDSMVPVVQLVKWLESNKSKLSLQSRNVIYQAKSLPAYLMLPTCPVCLITGQDLALCLDGLTFFSEDGSRWPACCITFSPLQTYKKRKSSCSSLFGKKCEINDPEWIKELLSMECLFSGTPLI